MFAFALVWPWIGIGAAGLLFVLLCTNALRSDRSVTRWGDMVWLTWAGAFAYLVHQFEEHGVDPDPVIVVYLGDGNDFAQSINDRAVGHSVTFYGEDGDDDLDSDGSADVLDGGPGNDLFTPDDDAAGPGPSRGGAPAPSRRRLRGGGRTVDPRVNHLVDPPLSGHA